MAVPWNSSWLKTGTEITDPSDLYLIPSSIRTDLLSFPTRTKF